MANPGSYRYGPYRDGPDPLAAPFDVRVALDEMSDAILGGSAPTNALQEALRRGFGNRRGLDDLLRQYPAIGPKLFDNGKLRPYINVFLNDEDIRYLDEMDTALQDGVTVALIPAVAGG